MTHTSDFEYTLTKPINNIHFEGHKVSTDYLVLSAPSNKNRRECAKIKQMFFRAMMDMQDRFAEKAKESKKAEDDGDINGKKSKEVKEDDLNGKQALSMILMSDKVDYCEVQDTFARMLVNGVCKTSQGVLLNTVMYDEMLESDAEGLMEKYVEHFFLSSWTTMIG